MFKRIVAVLTILTVAVSPIHADALAYDHRVISWQDASPLHISPLIYGTNGVPCTNGWGEGCEPKNGNVDVINFLPNCDLPEGLDIHVDCIDSVYAEVSGQLIKGQRVANQNGIDDRYSYIARPEYGIAKASSYEIYKFAGLSHEKGNLFMVYPWTSKSINIGKILDTQYTFLIAPVFQDSSMTCAQLHTANNLCWQSGSFSRDTKFNLNIRFATTPSGWFSGRITDPSIKIESLKDNRTPVSFTGISQSIPSIVRNFRSNVTTEYDEWVQVSKALTFLAWDGKNISSGIPFSSDAIREYENIVSKVSSFNNADALNNVWRVDLKSEFTPISSGTNCPKSSFTGIVSSNSMTYANSVPTWEPVSNSLIYNVASPHTAFGKEFQGRYDLLISEEIAKCLWGLKNLAPSAEISVTSATGEKKVFTASSSISNGFYKFTAAGFTFSANKISVKMLSEGSNPIKTSPIEAQPIPMPSATPTPLAMQSPASVVVKKVTITCVKGKVQKKVTAINPKCPTGYKKK